MGSQGDHFGGERNARPHGDQEKIWAIESVEGCADCRLPPHDCANCSVDRDTGGTWRSSECLKNLKQLSNFNLQVYHFIIIIND